MKKTFLILTVIVFSSAISFAQSHCSSIINLEQVEINEKELKNLQKALPLLDSLEQILINSDTMSVENNYAGSISWQTHRDIYNNYSDPAKALFERIVGNKTLNNKAICTDAIVYLNGKKLFSTHHYFTAYYAE